LFVLDLGGHLIGQTPQYKYMLETLTWRLVVALAPSSSTFNRSQHWLLLKSHLLFVYLIKSHLIFIINNSAYFFPTQEQLVSYCQIIARPLWDYCITLRSRPSLFCSSIKSFQVCESLEDLPQHEFLRSTVCGKYMSSLDCSIGPCCLIAT
jgi:hypothetical protein